MKTIKRFVGLITAIVCTATLICGVSVSAEIIDSPVGLALNSDKTTFTLEEVRTGKASTTVYVDVTTEFEASENVSFIEFNLKPNELGVIDPVNLQFCDPNVLGTDNGNEMRDFEVFGTVTSSFWTKSLPNDVPYVLLDYNNSEFQNYTDECLPKLIIMTASATGKLRTGGENAGEHLAQFDIEIPAYTEAGTYAINFTNASAGIGMLTSETNTMERCAITDLENLTITIRDSSENVETLPTEETTEAIESPDELVDGNLTYVRIDEDDDGIEDYIKIIDCTSDAHSILLPATIDDLVVKEIDPMAFASSVSIVDICVSPQNRYFSSDNGILFDKTGSQLICCPSAKVINSYEIPETIKTISDYAFANCKFLNTINMNDSVTSIGDYAFYNCSDLDTIDIPESVESIGTDAFAGTELLNFQIRNQAGPLYYADSWVIYSDNDVTTVMNASTPVKKGTTGIADGVFAGNSKLSRIDIPESVKYIGDSAFENCTELSSISMLESVRSIGSYAFSGCTAIVDISIPDTVSSMGVGAFKNCTKLLEVNIPTSLEEISESLFEGCSALLEINIPLSVDSIYKKAFFNCAALKKVIINNKNCVISDAPHTFSNSGTSFDGEIYGYTDSTARTYAVTYNRIFKEIYDSENDNNYEDIEFEYVISEYGAIITNIKNYGKNSNIVIPAEINYETVVGIGDYAFADFEGTVIISLPSTLMKAFVGKMAFITKSSVETYLNSKLGANPTEETYLTYVAKLIQYNGKIGDWTQEELAELKMRISEKAVLAGVSDDMDLTEITITMLKNRGCMNLDPEIITDPQLGYDIFASWEASITYTDVYVNTGEDTEMFEYVKNKEPFGMKLYTENYIVDNGVTYEKVDEDYDGIFNYISIVYCEEDSTVVDIPSEIDGLPVTSIGNYAFNECSVLENVTIPEGVTAIGECAFYGCNKLSEITIPATVETIGTKALGYTSSGEKISSFKIYGTVDTAAEAYALENGFTFIDIDSTSILNKTELVLDAGESYLLEVKNYDGEILWGLNDTAIATVNNGLVSAVAEGETIVYAIIGESVLKCNVTVNAVEADITTTTITDTPAISSSVSTTITSITGEKPSVTNESNAYTTSSDIIPDETTTSTTVSVTEEVTFSTDNNITSDTTLSSVTTDELSTNTTVSVTKMTTTDTSDTTTLSETTATIVTTTSADNSNHFEVKENNKTIVIVYCDESIVNVIVPSEINSVIVSKINDYAFSSENIETITFNNPDVEIADSETTINEDAVIYGYWDSTAHDYAIKYNREFISLDDVPKGEQGDANNDNDVNVRDAAFIAAALAKGQADTLPEHADYNNDGDVNVRDAAAIASALAKGKL